ncbi:antiviral reverse transcriptase Drt3b [Aeromicrobium endophyticum]|uniref:Reverse transcriptase domain-containing protein n=1 Tax=Aeromicrobium endophyticum TaxID=2292704 RepID=A0A371P9H9_9ACTN|nr:antiviral reverse transcriptase Drt3b [Aeromicrobium endophyticum]REK72597.1 hypothetical protein DX116_03005 [Aeromicrobium endophyticum]
MPRKHRVDVKHTPARVVVSEILPYEVPVGFDNLGLYKFLIAAKMQRHESRVHFSGTHPEMAVVLKIIFGSDTDVQPLPGGGYSIPTKSVEASTVPFQFLVRHKANQSRALSIAHPASQIGLVDFYDQFRSLLLLHTSTSPFSIRHPSRIARYTTFNDSVFSELKSAPGGSVEAEDREYARLRSYFVYRRFDNVYKFYESPEYRRHEKKFGHLLRLDVTKCFDSVYTHSIAWAVFGKNSSKLGLRQHPPKGTPRSFADEFDTRIRAMNDNETHGILIGPEVSRIFAEIILQRVDSDVEESLRADGILQGRDYEILRYVDDYFVFMRDTDQRDHIVRTLEDCLRPFRFHLNSAKEEINTTPFISALSVAKGRLWSDLEDRLCLHVDVVHGSSIEGYVDFRSSANSMISAYKTTLRETDLNPLDLVNSCLALIETRLEFEIEKFLNVDSQRLKVPTPADRERCAFYNRRNFMAALHAAVEFAFYVYGGSPRVGPAIKLARLVSLCRKAAKTTECSLDDRGRLDDLISTELTIQLNRNPLTQEASVESLYLLTLLAELGDEYAISLPSLCDFAGISAVGSHFHLPDWYNVLIVSDLLRFVTGNSQYMPILRAIEAWIVARCIDLESRGRREAEQPLLVLNVLAAPAISADTKYQILRLYGVKSRAEALLVSQSQDRWFTNWNIEDLHAELLYKRVQEVY